MLAYLADVFGHLNDINLSARPGCDSDVKDKLAGLTAQIVIWQAGIKVGSLPCFLCWKGAWK